MQEVIRVAVDAMGGDNAPGEIVKGAIEAVNTRRDIQVVLVGQQEVIAEELKKYTYEKDQIEIKNATEVIETAEHPVNAIRKKKDSSIVVGMNMVKQKEADAFVSAGSSGAVLVGGQVIVGRIRGIERPPLAPLIPTETGVSLLIDCGANVDANTRVQTRYLQDGSYLSIRNITLSYNFPSKWMSKIGVNNLAVFFSGENLYTFDHLPKGLDPERSVTDDLGQRGFTYPYMRQYSFGINLSF